LSEWDFGLDDGGILQIEESLNTNVRENPGTLVKEMNVKSGVALWSLTWVSGSSSFQSLRPAPRHVVRLPISSKRSRSPCQALRQKCRHFAVLDENHCRSEMPKN
jgi:hypothetical protein